MILGGNIHANAKQFGSYSVGTLYGGKKGKGRGTGFCIDHDPLKVVQLVIKKNTTNLPTSLKWLFFAFLFSFSFEAQDLGFMTGSLSVTKICGVLFLGSCLWFHNKCFASPPSAFYWFLAYFGVVYILMGIYIPAPLFGRLVSNAFTILQIFLLFWILSTILRDATLARWGLLAFSLGTSFSALGMIFGITGVELGHREGENIRMSALGFNANEFANILALGAVILVGVAFEKAPRNIFQKGIFFILAIPNLVGILYSGSRAGIAAVLMGMAFYPLPHRGSRRKLTAFIWGTLALIGIVLMFMIDPHASSRWEETINEGSTAGRDIIYEAAFDMVSERPLLGWGPVEFLYELGSRVGKVSRDPHNLFLFLLLEGGIVGAFFFLGGIWMCWRMAWRARKGPWGMMPIALMATLLIGNLSHTYLTKKPTWLVFSFAAASIFTVMKRNPQRVMTMVKGQS